MRIIEEEKRVKNEEKEREWKRQNNMHEILA